MRNSRRIPAIIARFAGVLLLMVTVIGCAAIGSRENEGAGRPYAGVRDDVYYLAHPSEADQPALQFFNVIDLPFSFLVDTVCLPWDLAAETR